MSEQKCPICERPSEFIPFADRDARKMQCKVCGEYYISGTAQMSLSNIKLEDAKKVAFAHWIYQNIPERGKEPFITGDNLNNILMNLNLPSVDEQFANLINHIGKNTEYPAKPVVIYKDRYSAIVGSVGPEGANYINNYLEEKRLIEHPGGDNSLYFFTLTPHGWEKYGEIKKGSSKSKEVFMAMKYGNPLLTQAYNFFKTAVEETGFKLQILDEMLKAGLIDDQLRVSIRQSKFLLADLPYSNPGAYWEAGYGEGLGKQVIYLCEKSSWKEEKTHFDTNHLTTVQWSLDTIADDMKTLKARIRSTFPAEAIMEDKNES